MQNSTGIASRVRILTVAALLWLGRITGPDQQGCPASRLHKRLLVILDFDASNSARVLEDFRNPRLRREHSASNLQCGTRVRAAVPLACVARLRVAAQQVTANRHSRVAAQQVRVRRTNVRTQEAKTELRTGIAESLRSKCVCGALATRKRAAGSFPGRRRARESLCSKCVCGVIAVRSRPTRFEPATYGVHGERHS